MYDRAGLSTKCTLIKTGFKNLRAGTEAKFRPFVDALGGTEIRGDQILPDCIGDRARISKEQEWMSPGGFCTEKVDYL